MLVLDHNEAYADGKGKEYYLNLLVNESTPYHDAIPDILKTYDRVTGLWPESPGYSFGTVQSLLDWAAPLKRAGIDIIAGNPILQKAAMAVFPWMDDAANMVVFGDSRGGSANFQTFENRSWLTKLTTTFATQLLTVLRFCSLVLRSKLKMQLLKKQLVQTCTS